MQESNQKTEEHLIELEELGLGAEDVFSNWQINEVTNYKKNKTWFVLAGLVFALLLVYSFYTANFSFAILLIIIAIVILIKDSQEINLLDVFLTHRGVKLGKKFYDFNDLKRFCIIYKPHEDKRAIIFEFKNVIRPEMIIPLENMNPLPIRENLIKYLDEDLERDDISTTENINRLLRL